MRTPGDGADPPPLRRRAVCSPWTRRANTGPHPPPSPSRCQDTRSGRGSQKFTPATRSAMTATFTPTSWRRTSKTVVKPRPGHSPGPEERPHPPGPRLRPGQADLERLQHLRTDFDRLHRRRPAGSHPFLKIRDTAPSKLSQTPSNHRMGFPRPNTNPLHTTKCHVI